MAVSNLSRRLFLKAGAAVAASGLLAACAPAAPAAPAAGGAASQGETPAGETFDLRVHVRAGGDLSDYFAQVQDQFKEIVPEAEVKLEVVPGNALDYAAKMLTLMAGAQVGDAVWSASRVGFNRRFMAIGLLMPLESFVEAESFNVEQYYPYCIEEATYDGQLMALPHISEPGQIGLLMNLDLLEQAGVEPLTFESTLEDLINAAAAVRESAGENIFGFTRPNDYFNWVTHARSFGGDFLNPEGTECILDENALAAFQHLYDLVYDLGVAPAPAQIAENVDKMFQGQSLALTPCWPVQASQLPQTIQDFQVGTTMLPPGPAGRGSMLNQHMMSVAAAATHPEAAWEWTKWTCSADFSLTRGLAGRGGPVGIPEVWHNEELLTKFPSWREWAQVMDEVGPNYTAANLRGKELEDTFNQGVSSIMVQETTVEQGFENLVAACQEVLNRPPAT